jgi:LCP family protein required for cell wall assembly
MAHFPPPFDPADPVQPGAPPTPPPPPPIAAGGPPVLPPDLTPPTYGQPPPRQRRRPLRWFFAIVIAAAVYVFLALATFVQPVTIAGVSLSVPLPGMAPERIFGLPDEPFTVMVVGLDMRPGQEGGPARTDSILLLRVDPEDNRAAILSIPRDTMMQVPWGDGTSTNDRINTAFVYNWSSEDPSAAPAALAETIEHNLGIEVDHHIVFDQRDAASIIDAAGGVTVTSRQAFGQEDYSDDDVNVVPQFFPEGSQHLDGYQAVAYGRIREGSSDFDRIIRQQQVAEGLLEQLSTPSSLLRLDDVWNAYDDGVESSLSRRQTAGLFMLLKRAGSDRLVTRSLGDAAVSCSWCTASLVQLLPEETARIISEAFGDDQAGATAAQLLVAAGVTP